MQICPRNMESGRVPLLLVDQDHTKTAFHASIKRLEIMADLRYLGHLTHLFPEDRDLLTVDRRSLSFFGLRGN